MKYSSPSGELNVIPTVAPALMAATKAMAVGDIVAIGFDWALFIRPIWMFTMKFE